MYDNVYFHGNPYLDLATASTQTVQAIQALKTKIVKYDQPQLTELTYSFSVAPQFAELDQKAAKLKLAMAKESADPVPID